MKTLKAGRNDKLKAAKMRAKNQKLSDMPTEFF